MLKPFEYGGVASVRKIGGKRGDIIGNAEIPA